MTHGIIKIISGGQTGTDRAALDFARENDIEAGGFVPFGRMAEDGRIPAKYQKLIETSSSDPRVRTGKNILNSDATLIISHGELSGGSLLTKQLALRYQTPFLHIDLSALSMQDGVKTAADWLSAAKPAVLNIAGPRASEDPGIYMSVRTFLRRLIGRANKERGDSASS